MRAGSTAQEAPAEVRSGWRVAAPPRGWRICRKRRCSSRRAACARSEGPGAQQDSSSAGPVVFLPRPNFADHHGRVAGSRSGAAEPRVEDSARELRLDRAGVGMCALERGAPIGICIAALRQAHLGRAHHCHCLWRGLGEEVLGGLLSRKATGCAWDTIEILKKAGPLPAADQAVVALALARRSMKFAFGENGLPMMADDLRPGGRLHMPGVGAVEEWIASKAPRCRPVPLARRPLPGI